MVGEVNVFNLLTFLNQKESENISINNKKKSVFNLAKS